jgi:Tol biopolymer transport system component
MVRKRENHRSIFRYILVFVFLSAVISIAVYQLSDQSFFADVYIQYPDGLTRMVSPTENGIYYEPSIDPKGKYVVFFGNVAGPPRIWRTDLSTFETIALTPSTYGSRHPAYSGDGSQIVFASDMNSGQEPELVEQMGKNGLPSKGHITNLYIMDNIGRNIRQVTFGTFQDQRPCFSPDGKTIAFVSNRNGSTRIWEISASGQSEPRQILFGRYGYRPWFSTDGQWIFFFTKVDGRDQIAKTPATGGDVTLLINDERGNSHGPFADPNGEVLLIHSYRDGKYNIFELPLDGSPPRLIQPSGFEEATHASRSENGIMAFDVITNKWMLHRAAKWIKIKAYIISDEINKLGTYNNKLRSFIRQEP